MLLKKFSLKNKIVVITGGAGLLGKHFSEVIAIAGGTPIILDIDFKKAKEISSRLNKLYDCESLGLKCNILREQDVRSILKKIIFRFKKKKLFGLINNAAYNPQPKKNINNSLEQFSLKKWKKEIDVGLTGAFICIKIFGEYFSKNKAGSIINISSDLGVKAPKQSLYNHMNYIKPITYSAVKHAIHGLTKYVCSYWAKSKVRCNTLAPGGVFNNQDKKFILKLKREIPANRMANLDDLDGIIIYLLSDLSSFTNGSFISVDGGRSAL